MQREFVVDGEVFNYHHFIYCVNCEARIARIEHYVPNVHDLLYGGYFKRLTDVLVIDQPKFHRHEDGNNLTTANTYCLRCNELIGWKLIAASRQTDYFVEGRFFMRFGMLMFKNRVTLRSYIIGSAYRQGLIQVEGANAQLIGSSNAQVIGGINAQVGGANAQAIGGINAQVGGANAKVIGGVNAQVEAANAQLIGGVNAQVGGANAELIGGVNAQFGGANAQVTGGVNARVTGGVNAQVRGATDHPLLYLNEEKAGGTSDQAMLYLNEEPVGDANEEGPNDENGAPPME